MSVGGSPTAESTGGGLQMDGAQIAMRMIAATEAASSAALSASQALAAIQAVPGSQSSENKNDWYKILPKPGFFDPKDRETELATFRDWWWQMEQYIVAVEPKFAQDLDKMRGNMDEEIILEEMDAETTKRSSFLFGLLASVLRNRPLMMLKGIAQGNGLEATRQLFKSCQPSNRNRSLGMLNALMSWPQFDMRTALLPQVLRLEDCFREYEKTATKLADELKYAVLMKSLGGQLKTFLQVSMKDDATYDQLRETALQYDQSTIKWSHQMAIGIPLPGNDQGDAMDVDRVYEKGGKGKGKQKGKGKFDQKGKGKGKGKTTWNSTNGKGNKGSWDAKGKGQGNQQSSWNNGGYSNSNAWNKGNNHSGKQGKSNKGGKGKTNNKGKGKAEGCFKCGSMEHYARDCQVRQVEEHDKSGNQQHSSGKSDTQYSTSTGHVNRVSFPDNCFSSVQPQLNFDLTAFGDFSGLHVNMVSETCCSDSDMSWEQLETSNFHDTLLCSADLSDLSSAMSLSLCSIDRSCYSERSSSEYFLEEDDQQSCTQRFALHELFNIDDGMHYLDCVFSEYGFENYEIAVQPPQKCLRRFQDTCCFKVQCLKPGTVKSVSTPCSHVRAVKIDEFVDIVLDSGSDATVLPVSMAHLGEDADNPYGSYLRDAQGSPIPTSAVKNVDLTFVTTDGQEVHFTDRAHFSSRVETPLLSYGKLLKAGWSIISGSGPPMLTHMSGASIELGFKNHSLLLTGNIRAVQECRAVSVTIPRLWEKLGPGWYNQDDVEICNASGRCFIDPTEDHLVYDWPYRTTLAFHDTRGWELLELCKKIFTMSDRSAEIPGGYLQTLTVLTKRVMTENELGLQVVQPQERQQAEHQAPVRGSQNGATGRGDAPSPQEDIPRSMAIEPSEDSVTVAGVVVTKTSSIAVLKAACTYLQVSLSGSKQKLWSRILATLDKQAILAERELATVALKESERDVASAPKSEPPADQKEIDAHNLTHLPYKDWCIACTMGKSRPDRHSFDKSAVQRREIPVVSWDLCFTSKTCEAVESESEGSKLTALVMHDSHTGSIHCVPIHSKAQAKYMSMEVMRFINYLGYGDVALRCDQEPTMLQVQKLVQRSRQRLNMRTIIENPKVLDHGGNSAVEKAIDRVRSQASVFIHALSTNIKHDIPVTHPLFAWAFTHAAWTLSRFSVKAGTTPYELVSGHAYQGRLCPFGSPVMVYVADGSKAKGDAKWHKGIYLTKSWTNDMHLTAVGGTLRLSRSVKSLFPKWDDCMEQYRQVVTYPWQMESSVGNRILPTVSRDGPNVIAAPGIDDEAGSDAESVKDEGAAESFPVVPALQGIPIATASGSRMVPPPSSAAPSGKVEATPLIAQRGDLEMGSQKPDVQTIGQAGATGSGLAQAGLSADISMETEDADAGPATKRQKTDVMRVGDELLYHMDIENDEYFTGDMDGMINYPDDFVEDYMDEQDDAVDLATDECLWKPLTQSEPVVGFEELAKIDAYADSVELGRLTAMGVIQPQHEFSGELGSTLSAKMVRTWRKKQKKVLDSDGKVISEEYAWMRRSRLVAREFAWANIRDDVYSPASNSSIIKLLPCLALTDGFVPDCVCGVLDFTDAFLQVPQPVPRVVTLDGVRYVILRCLPGQRDASRLWYEFIVNKMKSKLGASVCAEQPCILKVSSGDSASGTYKTANKCAMLIHVDDILFIGDSEWIKSEFIPVLEKEFKMTYNIEDRQTGGQLEFLKRTHVFEPKYDSLTVVPESKYTDTLVKRYTKVNGKAPKLAKTPCMGPLFAADPLTCPGLSEELCAEYRSLVGIIQYMAQERYDIQFASKSLASFLREPNSLAWSALGRLIGYLKATEHYALKMNRNQKGSSFMETMMATDSDSKRKRNFLEVFTDADWSGSGSLKSTSSAVHVLNGVVIHSSSRTQKCISLSSTESEWYSASAGVCDNLYLNHLVSFLTDGDVEPSVLHVDNSAVRMLSMKLGAGRLRHIKGRYLWLQQLATAGEIEIKQVKTQYNVADCNTKPLNRDRFRSLLHMMGFVSDFEAIGADEFARMQMKCAVKSQVRAIRETFLDDAELPGQRNGSIMNGMAKKVLRVLSAMSLFVTTCFGVASR